MQVTLQSQVDKITTGDGDIKEYSPRERTIRALKTLGAFWLGSIISILLPVVHFVSVPGLFLAGPFMAWVQYKKELKVHHITGACPECRKEITFQNISGSWPLRQICPQCSAQIYINTENRK